MSFCDLDLKDTFNIGRLISTSEVVCLSWAANDRVTATKIYAANCISWLTLCRYGSLCQLTYANFVHFNGKGDILSDPGCTDPRQTAVPHLSNIQLYSDVCITICSSDSDMYVIQHQGISAVSIYIRSDACLHQCQAVLSVLAAASTVLCWRSHAALCRDRASAGLESSELSSRRQSAVFHTSSRGKH